MYVYLFNNLILIFYARSQDPFETMLVPYVITYDATQVSLLTDFPKLVWSELLIRFWLAGWFCTFESKGS